MARLPNNERAILDIRKIERYCLDPEHPRGRHKARLFRELLGVTRTDSPWLRDALLKALRNSEAVALAADSFVKWSRLSEQIFRIDKWSLCQG